MNELLSLIVSLALLPGAVFAASTLDCVKANKTQIEALFDKRNESLKTDNAQTVSENYLSDAVLLPTVSNKARLTDAECVDCFKHFLAKKPTGKIDVRTIRLGCNKAMDTGAYISTFVDKSAVSTRYAFTYVWGGKKWKASTHRSSAMPKG